MGVDVRVTGPRRLCFDRWPTAGAVGGRHVRARAWRRCVAAGLMLGVADGMVLSQPASLRAGLRGWEYRAQGFAATGPVG